MWGSSKSVSGVGAAAEQLCYAGYSIFNISHPPSLGLVTAVASLRLRQRNQSASSEIAGTGGNL